MKTPGAEADPEIGKLNRRDKHAIEQSGVPVFDVSVAFPP
jgi:hypothetical protein